MCDGSDNFLYALVVFYCEFRQGAKFNFVENFFERILSNSSLKAMFDKHVFAKVINFS